MTRRHAVHPLRGALCALVLAWFPGPLPAQDKKAATDLERLQGMWERVVAERDGGEFGRTVAEDFRPKVRFQDDKFTLLIGDDLAAKGTVKLDPAASPKAIDLIYVGNEDPTLRGQVRLGIYEVDGDTLRLCCTDLFARVPRPKEFKTAKADKLMIQTFKRVK